MRHAAVFDRTGRVRPPPMRRFLAEWWAVTVRPPPPPDPARLPPGGGRPVLVIPAFLTGDLPTAPIRRFLDRCGYRVRGWGLGVNLGPMPARLAALRRLLDAMQAGAGQPVALVGYSLGGLLARWLAQAAPGQVCHVATLGSPVRLPTASPLAPLFRPLLPLYDPGFDPALLMQPLPLPVTAVWTRRDGIVAPETCLPPEPDSAFEAAGTHMTLGSDPAVLVLLARRLAPGPACGAAETARASRAAAGETTA